MRQKPTERYNTEYGTGREEKRLNASWTGNYKEGKKLDSEVKRLTEAHGADRVFVGKAYEPLGNDEIKGSKAIYVSDKVLEDIKDEENA